MLLKDPLAALNCCWRLCQRFTSWLPFHHVHLQIGQRVWLRLFSYFPLLGSQQGDNRCSNECVYHDKAEGGHTHRWLALLEKAAFFASMHTHKRTDGRTHTVCCVLQRWSVSPQKRSDQDDRLEAFGGEFQTHHLFFLFVHTSLFPTFTKCATKEKFYSYLVLGRTIKSNF